MDKKLVVIIMYGCPATGKTFIAKKLTNSLKRRYKIINIATLDFRKKFNLFNLESNEQRNKVYDLLTEYVLETVNNKNHDIIIIDGNFNKRYRREKIYSILREVRAIIYVIKCVVSNEDTIQKRIEERQRNSHILENKAAKMELYHMIKDSTDNIEEDELVKKNLINLLQFNSEENTIERQKLGKINDSGKISDAILSVLTHLHT